MKKKRRNKIKRKIKLLWYAPWVWFSELCREPASDPIRAEKTIRHWVITSTVLFMLCSLMLIALIFVWGLIF